MRVVELSFGWSENREQVADEQRAAEREHEVREEILTEEHVGEDTAAPPAAYSRTRAVRCHTEVVFAIANTSGTILVMTKILRIDSSARSGDSVSRELTQRLVGRLTDAASGDVEVATRDLAAGVPFLSESTLQAMWTPEADRTPEQNEQLTVADEFIRELAAADALVFGLPIYNFGPPAVVKAWPTWSLAPARPSATPSRGRKGW